MVVERYTYQQLTYQIGRGVPSKLVYNQRPGAADEMHTYLSRHLLAYMCPVCPVMNGPILSIKMYLINMVHFIYIYMLRRKKVYTIY